ncbi:MAG: DNA topoisomerase I, partial [Planctomycetes bacterium]|nr:DNA topoisomerase I [Planctomycetota bacterium]
MASKKSSKNGKYLVIVESPAKSRTINKYLGSDFVVMASLGHVRDLPGKSMSVDIENGFKPTYEVLTSSRKTISQLKKAASTARMVYLATDMDREGEAIAWHVAEALGLKPGEYTRVVFNQITKKAIQEAFANTQ